MRAAGQRRQRGAAMVIAAVFLIGAVLVYGLVAMRMAGTGVTDSALVADAAEALFLAESGLERAAQRLADGTACAALAPDAAQAFGNGDFQILSAVDVGGLCRVQVRGRRLLGGQARAQRVIEGDLQPAGGDTWAGGKRSTLLRYDGSSWSVYAPPPPDDVDGLACAAGICYAVGKNGYIERWDGSAWSPSGSAASDLKDVACETANPDACFAVGKNATVLRWSGGPAWSPVAVPVSSELRGVYCGTGICYAVGKRDSGDPVALRWSGSGWVREDTSLSSHRDFTDVACLPGDPDRCFATGNRRRITERNGFGTPSWIDGAATPARLEAIDCPTDNFCLAVGKRGKAMRWDGSTWSPLATITGQDLKGVACEAGRSDNCFAVGRQGVLIHWNGSGWTTTGSPTANELRAVAIGGSGGGAVTLARWRERVF